MSGTDPLDPTSREAVARDIARALYTAESLCHFNETETLITMHLGLNFDGLSAAGLARATGRDRRTVRARLQMMDKRGNVTRVGNVWRLTKLGLRQRADDFESIWRHLPQEIKDIITRECERRRGALPL